MPAISRGELIGGLSLLLAVVAVMVVQYQVVTTSEQNLEAKLERSEQNLEAKLERSEQNLEAKLDRTESELKAELAELQAQMTRLIESVDSRLDEVEKNQARLEAVNELLAQRFLQQ